MGVSTETSLGWLIARWEPAFEPQDKSVGGIVLSMFLFLNRRAQL